MFRSSGEVENERVNLEPIVLRIVGGRMLTPHQPPHNPVNPVKVLNACLARWAQQLKLALDMIIYSWLS